MAYAPLPSRTYGGFAMGNPGVTYDDQGRLQYNAVPTTAATGAAGVRNNFFWRSSASTPIQNVRTRWSFLPWNRGAPAAPAAAPLVTRTRFDDYATFAPGLGYREFVSAPAQTAVISERRMAMPPSKSDQLVVEEMKIYNQRPPWWWLFIVLGILLLLLAVVNILFCVEMHYLCRIWAGIALIIFGIVGAIHRGDYYRQKWKSWLYIIVGTITACMVFACLAFAMETFCHQLIEIAQFNDKDAYIAEMKYRFTYLNIKPNIVIRDDVENNIWLCFALDAVALVILTIAFLVPTAVCFVIDRFYNSNWVITRRVEPFCEPSIFNPWGQVSFGSAMIYVGMVVNASVHGNRVREWQNTYAPVWSGAFPMLAGVFTALALKSCGLRRRCWNIFSIILELISGIVSIIGIIFMLIGMIENIETLRESAVMTFTSFTHRMMFASILLFCIGLLFCLINVVWSIALLIRLIYCFCCTRDERQINVQYIYDDSAAYARDGKKVYTDRPGAVWEKEERVVRYDDTGLESPYMIGRDSRPYVVD